MNIYKPKDFAKMINVSVKTLQRWDNENTLKAYRNPKYTIIEKPYKNGLSKNMVIDLIFVTTLTYI